MSAMYIKFPSVNSAYSPYFQAGFGLMVRLFTRQNHLECPYLRCEGGRSGPDSPTTISRARINSTPKTNACHPGNQ